MLEIMVELRRNILLYTVIISAKPYRRFSVYKGEAK